MGLCGKIFGIVKWFEKNTWVCDQMFCESEHLEVFLVYSGSTILTKVPSDSLLTINI